MTPSSLLMMLLAFVWIQTAEPRVIEKTVHLAEFRETKQSAIFLAKFDIGIGQGKITVKLKKSNKKDKENTLVKGLNIGIVKDNQYSHFKSLSNCSDRIPLYQQVIPVKFYDSINARHTIEIQNTDSEHINYIYLFDCHAHNQEQAISETLNARITMYNNGSHFGEDENFIAGYIITLTVWAFIFIRFACSVLQSIQRSTGIQKFIFYISFLILGLGQFYHCLNILMISYNGEDIIFLFYLYACLKCIAESVLVTTLVAIAWGWSIIHLKHDSSYIIVGTSIFLVNTICIVIEGISEDLEEIHHKYDGTSGTVLLILRILIFVTFIIGILRSLSKSVGKTKIFLEKFSIRGGAYLLSWPVAVILSELLLPNYLHKEVITFSEDLSHLIGTAMVGYLFAFPDSDYHKVDKREEYMFNLG